jgi:hypothetical protein
MKVDFSRLKNIAKVCKALADNKVSKHEYNYVVFKKDNKISFHQNDWVACFDAVLHQMESEYVFTHLEDIYKFVNMVKKPKSKFVNFDNKENTVSIDNIAYPIRYLDKEDYFFHNFDSEKPVAKIPTASLQNMVKYADKIGVRFTKDSIAAVNDEFVSVISLTDAKEFDSFTIEAIAKLDVFLRYANQSRVALSIDGENGITFSSDNAALTLTKGFTNYPNFQTIANLVNQGDEIIISRRHFEAIATIVNNLNSDDCILKFEVLPLVNDLLKVSVVDGVNTIFSCVTKAKFEQCSNFIVNANTFVKLERSLSNSVISLVKNGEVVKLSDRNDVNHYFQTV